MKKCISNKSKNVLKAIALITALWFLLSLFNSEHVVPPPRSVFAKLIEILTTPELLINIGITFFRLFLAMTISIILGTALGVLSVVIPKIKEVVKEMLNIFQVVPPVSILIMAIMWFGLNGMPAIFIVVVSLIPLIAVNMIDATDNVDVKLLEMAKVYQLSKLDIVWRIYIPSVREQLWTAIKIGLTMGAKILVMGEVLTTTTGIGGKITTARLNLEPESVIAWTVITVCLYFLLEKVIDFVKKRSIYENA